MRTFFQNTRLLLVTLLVAITVATRAIVPLHLEHAPATPEELAAPLLIWHEQQTNPAMSIYVVRVDLCSPNLEVITMPADDPDGDGPAEATLTDPLTLAEHYHALAAVNANAFAGLPGLDGKTANHFYAGQPVDIIGLAVSAGKVRSGAETNPANNYAFWIDADRQAHIGSVPEKTTNIREGVNIWWTELLKEGKVLQQPGGDCHPRTAVGLDAAARTLYLVVVDGRQPGYSTGMTTAELAGVMARLGCDRAINLDGGGSSIMLIADQNDKLTIKNRPSGGKPRPVPLLLGVRARNGGETPQ